MTAALEPDFRQKLTYRFRKQEEFAADYSPLYSRFFSTVANWLADDTDDQVTDWLFAASNGRSAFDIPLLLAAGLHRDILLQVPEVAELAAYYPSAGGERPFTDPHFATALRQAILMRRDALAAFIQAATVQTNETGRGLCWLLPLHYSRWTAVHLVDLGASAGLNLAANLRAYRLVDEATNQVLLDLGSAPPTQFITRCHTPLPPYPLTPLPQILSRVGGDIQPFVLETAVHESTLAAYIWPDQIHRIQRLREGIAAFHTINHTAAPVQLLPLTLPDDLPKFLANHMPSGPAPIVLYNTYITQYLPHKGTHLRQNLAAWAASQPRPILWLQWEPDRSGQDAPEYGWLKWTADLWHNHTHQQFHLAWVHPHGTHLQLEPGFWQWIEQN
ncbi:MAG: DUF2332 domain-containing protein [Ardenticatenaceae bacterium]|nr:DUF2332 domain-containing protein [Ardenticatenaceae bacterium]